MAAVLLSPGRQDSNVPIQLPFATDSSLFSRGASPLGTSASHAAPAAANASTADNDSVTPLATAPPQAARASRDSYQAASYNAYSSTSPRPAEQAEQAVQPPFPAVTDTGTNYSPVSPGAASTSKAAYGGDVQAAYRRSGSLASSSGYQAQPEPYGQVQHVRTPNTQSPPRVSNDYATQAYGQPTSDLRRLTGEKIN